MSGLHIFDAHLEAANAWLRSLMTELELATDEQARAVHAMRAGLHAIRDRLPAAEVTDLAAQLPTIIRGLFYEGWNANHDPTQIRERAAMIARVRRELGQDRRLSAYVVLRAVVRVLVSHISAGEIDDVLATLPGPVAALWRELAGPPATRGPTTGGLARRTGYAR